jgi:hypothetical protein
MISSNLTGGLGNQMFQIAATFAHAKKINAEYWFDFSKSHVLTQGNTANKYENNFFKNIKNSIIDTTKLIQYNEPSFSYKEIPNIDNMILNGYFQSEKYFLNVKDEIKNIFHIDLEISNKIKNFILKTTEGKKTTSIHVRRGDFLTKTNYHPTQNMDYYNKGIELTNTEKYIIVSDDINWCKDNFIGDKFIFSDFNDDIYDFILIMNCNNHIISNSSFSWWSSYLCADKNKIIVSPKLWFGINAPKDTQDIYLDEWIKV